MWTLIVFNLVMVAAAAVATMAVPTKILSDALYWLHVSMGITAPTTKNARIVALIWIGALAAMVDGLALLLVWLT